MAEAWTQDHTLHRPPEDPFDPSPNPCPSHFKTVFKSWWFHVGLPPCRLGRVNFSDQWAPLTGSNITWFNFAYLKAQLEAQKRKGMQSLTNNLQYWREEQNHIFSWISISQPPHDWHPGLANSLFWGLCYASWDIQHHSCRLPTRCQWQCAPHP